MAVIIDLSKYIAQFQVMSGGNAENPFFGQVPEYLGGGCNSLNGIGAPEHFVYYAENRQILLCPFDYPFERFNLGDVLTLAMHHAVLNGH